MAKQMKDIIEDLEKIVELKEEKARLLNIENYNYKIDLMIYKLKNNFDFEECNKVH